MVHDEIVINIYILVPFDIFKVVHLQNVTPNFPVKYVLKSKKEKNQPTLKHFQSYF